MADYANKIMDSLKEAMKNKDTQVRDTLRVLQAAFKQVQVDERRDLSNDDEVAILQKEAKKRRETIDELQKMGREIGAEQFELALIEGFLPKQLSRDEITALAQAAIAQTGATTAKEMGKVMGILREQTKGIADGGLVSQVVKELLSS